MEREQIERENTASSRSALSRRNFLKGLAAVGVAAGGGFLVSGRQAYANPAAGLDPVERLAYDRLKHFTDWLKREGVRGYVGEVGWPSNRNRDFGDGPKWNILADKWYGWADNANLWVTAHDANERQLWGGYYMSIYVSVEQGLKRAISVAKPQAQVLESHLGASSYMRGLNMPSGNNMDRSAFHQGNLGTFSGVGPNNYWYSGVDNDGPGGRNSFEFLHDRGVRVARLGFRWERFMPGGPGTSLDAVELARYRSSVDAAGAAGVKVIVDVHNYGGYWFEGANGKGDRHPINGSRVGIEHFVDLWGQLSGVFKDDPAVVAYDLMNEPYVDGGISEGRFISEELAWENTTQRAVERIRGLGDGKLIIVPVYSHIEKISRNHPKKWINDPADNHMYTAHQYFDTFRGPGTGGGSYEHSYDNEVAYLKNETPANPPPQETDAQIKAEAERELARKRREAYLKRLRLRRRRLLILRRRRNRR